MFVVDTNVLVYAADRDSPFHRRCLELVDRWRRQAPVWYLTWGIVYEFLRATTHPRVLRKPWTAAAAWNFIQSVFASPSVEILVPGERHAEVAAEVFAELPHLRGNLFHDAATAILMREHGIRRIYTRDADFHRFPFVEPVDPVA
ncbi:MAG: PIN domain-containing protein [Bryobacterales bacterium]|nr:PIN domain-containing protein [Bryobacteraceae bacterium]MDW8353179.1 PIN domain-containing protein [Bryobacterales bacterium]